MSTLSINEKFILHPFKYFRKLIEEFFDMFEDKDKKTHFYLHQNTIICGNNDSAWETYFHNGIIYRKQEYLQLWTYIKGSERLNEVIKKLNELQLPFIFDNSQYVSVKENICKYIDDTYKLESLKDEHISIYVLRDRYNECKFIEDEEMKRQKEMTNIKL